MPSEFTVWLSLVLVFAAVVVKIATANFIAGQKKQLSDLQSSLIKVQDHVRTLIEHNASAKENLLFYQRREAEITKQLEVLRPELDQYVESERKHLQSLGYDPDEEGVTLEEIGAAAYQEGGDSGPPGDEPAPRPLLCRGPNLQRKRARPFSRRAATSTPPCRSALCRR